MKAQPEIDPQRIGLIGWGVGGAVCVEVTAREDAVKAVATLNSFVDGVRWMRMGMGNDKYHRKLLRNLCSTKSATLFMLYINICL